MEVIENSEKCHVLLTILTRISNCSVFLHLLYIAHQNVLEFLLHCEVRLTIYRSTWWVSIHGSDWQFWEMSCL